MFGTPGVSSDTKILVPEPGHSAPVIPIESLQSQSQKDGKKQPTRTIPPYPNIHSVSTPLMDDYPTGMTALTDTPVLYIEGEETIVSHVQGKLYTYRVVDAFGRYLYKAEEHSSRHGSSRPFEVYFIDAKRQHVFRIRRRSNCWLCFLGSKCYGNNIEVYKMDGELIGEVKQLWSCGLRFEIFDGKGKFIMRIEGPKRVTCMCPSIMSKEPMNLLSIEPDNTSPVIGTFNVISEFANKDFRGIVFGMQFPYEFTCELKALVLGAGMMIDFTFCETQPSRLCSWYGSGFLTILFSVTFCTLLGILAWIFIPY